MKPEDIHLTDLQRIFIGEIPAIFFIELIFRSLFIYLLLVLSMRLMGKRMASKVSRNEMAAVASLAAAVGIPLMNPDRGLLPGLVIAFVIVVLQILIARRSARNEKFEAISQDKISMLVKDGILVLDNMKKTRISRERVFAQLRFMQKTHLGMIERLYLEANGLFSIVERQNHEPGLSIMPKTDFEFVKRNNTTTLFLVCHNCGYLSKEPILPHVDLCPNCNAKDWDFAVE
jgi:uncharacterized membrane protein YcaP (DUF421 family)